MLMVSKVQDELRHLLVSTVRLGNRGKSQDYFVPCPTGNLIYSLRF